MKPIFLFIAVLISIASYSQEDTIHKQLFAPRDITDCELITLNAVDILAESLSASQFDTFNSTLHEWIKLCGISECAQRLRILKAIIHNESSVNLINNYLESDFHYVMKDRIYTSRKGNYGFLYTTEKTYFGFVPLRSEIDSVVMKKSHELLDSKVLNPDEKLICILFSGDIEGFDKGLKAREYKESAIKNHFMKENREYGNNWMTYTLYSGFYKPTGPHQIFGYSPIIGLTISLPLSNKFVVEVGAKFRININDKSFRYYAMEDTNTVNSDYSSFFGGLISYKLYENDKVVLLPKFGIGYEIVSTGLSEKKNNSQDKTVYDIETINLSIGFSVMHPVFKKSYIGFSLNYHFSPYHLDRDLLTTFDNNSISSEIFFRF